MSNHQDPYVVIEAFMKRKYGDKFYEKQDWENQVWESYIKEKAFREGGKAIKPKDLLKDDVFDNLKLVSKLEEILKSKEDEEEEDYYKKRINLIDNEIKKTKSLVAVGKEAYKKYYKNFYKPLLDEREENRDDPLFVSEYKEVKKELDDMAFDLEEDDKKIKKLEKIKKKLLKEKENITKEEKKYEKRIKPIREKQQKEIEQEDELRSALSRLRLV